MMKIDKKHSKSIYEHAKALTDLLREVPTNMQLGSSCNVNISTLMKELNKFDETGLKGENNVEGSSSEVEVSVS
jgi:hypothetical protein